MGLTFANGNFKACMKEEKEQLLKHKMGPKQF